MEIRKTIRIALRDYNESVRSKAFIIAIIIAPFFMFGGLLAMKLFEGQVDLTDKRIAVVDRSGMIAQVLVNAATERNKSFIYDEETGEKIRPAYLIEVVEPQDDALAQRLKLSERVRAKEIFAFVEIGKDIISPGEDSQRSPLAFHSENAIQDEIPSWLARPINQHLRYLRGTDAGLNEEMVDRIVQWTPIDSLGLVTVDESTGEVKDAQQSNEFLAVMIPIFLVMFMLLMIMMGASPLINSTIEEKTQRISEVLLGSVRPFELMMGKLLGNLGVSFTAGIVYVIVGITAVNQMGIAEQVPLHVLPWFFIYVFAAISMNGAMFMAVGSACNEAKEAQSLMMPLMLPVMIPMFLMVPVIREPTSGFATWLSLFPPFTPMLMLIRQAIPGGVPLWQPLAGLVGVALFTFLYVWAAGRIFRVGLLMRGQPPKIGILLRWVIRG